MPILYFDNFRGFDSKLLQLKEINFFVGENSTGKTSVLKLLGIMSSPNFWRHNLFGEDKDGTSLGSFSEIISNSSEKQHFDVALYDIKRNRTDNVCGYKFRFIERDNFPSIKEIRYVDEDLELQATIDGKNLKYRFEVKETHEKLDENNVNFFEHWVHNNPLRDKVFKRSKTDHASLMQIIFQIQSMINFELHKLKHDEAEREILKIGFPNLLNNVAWFAPNVAPPSKTYVQQPLVFDAHGKHAPSVLQDIIGNNDVTAILMRFGADSGLFKSINVKDLGQESEALELEFSVEDSNKHMLNITNVGYGVSQILPIVIESIARPDSCWIACQQPETHLHPKAQAAFGEFIFKANLKDRQKFILETHSDFIIDRYRLRLNSSSKDGSTSNDSISQVIFFSRDGNNNTFDIIKIKNDGSYGEDQPDGFRDFFFREQLNLLQI